MILGLGITRYSEQPTVGTKAYPPKIYHRNPNWRGFVGTTLLITLEVFAHLILDIVICRLTSSS